MRLYLVHHAEAKREDEDPARPLTALGVQDARRVARYATKQGRVRVGRIFHSGKTRAEQTARVWAESLLDAQVVHVDDLGPQADPTIWAERLATETSDVMLVGHFPHLARLAARLLCAHDGEVLTPFNGGITCLERTGLGRWAIHWMLAPDVIDDESGR
ncbi:MAG TPA: phosphohistidine phosphatase SixA [bacterium]|nr:phosphohistidine phosphatase SixA [bacterium]